MRAVAGNTNNYSWVDYFPSYEIINSPAMRGVFFDPNMRSVNPRGVDFVMDQFFGALARKFGDDTPVERKKGKGALPPQNPDDIVCEEELLEAFGEPK
ncbi:MAG: GSCFA domain-containing protein [Asticcacaulis sp.]